MWFIGLLKYAVIIVRKRTEKRLSTVKKPCADDETYSFYKCTESYFYEQRGCQYPWNVYKDLNIKICTNSEIYSIPYLKDRDQGYLRETFSQSERLLRTRNRCPPPCSIQHYDVVLESWLHNSDPNSTSLQIAFENFITHHKEEYLGCDRTCIIGEVGGNLGLFLGGSFLLGLDIVFGLITKIIEVVCNKIRH